MIFSHKIVLTLIFLLILYTILTAFVSISIFHLMANKKIEQLYPIYSINVSIDCCFTLREKKLIIESLIQWQEATHGLIVFRLICMNSHRLIKNEEDDSSSYTINFIRALSKDEQIIEWDAVLKNSALGYAQGFEPCGLAFIIADRLYHDNAIFTATCGHEVGHLLGLSHNENKNALMYKYIKALKPTQYDIKELVLLWRDWIAN